MALTILDLWTQFSSNTTFHSYVQILKQGSSSKGIGDYIMRNYETLKGQHFPIIPVSVLIKLAEILHIDAKRRPCNSKDLEHALIEEAKKLNLDVTEYHPNESQSAVIAFILKGHQMFKLAVSISSNDARKKTLYESLKLYEIAQNNAVDDISISVYCKEKIGIIYYLLSAIEKVDEQKFLLLKTSVDYFLDAADLKYRQELYFLGVQHLSANVIDYFTEALEQYSKSPLLTKDMEKQFAVKTANRVGPSLLDTHDSFTTCVETSDDKSCSNFLKMYLQGLKESENDSNKNSPLTIHVGSKVRIKDVDHYKPYFKANETATVISIDKINKRYKVVKSSLKSAWVKCDDVILLQFGDDHEDKLVYYQHDQTKHGYLVLMFFFIIVIPLSLLYCACSCCFSFTRLLFVIKKEKND